MTKVFIIVLNFNGGKDIVECLESLKRESKRVKEQEVEILVVDNGSRDGSVEEIKKMIKKNERIKLIENERNLGFAAGNNVGIKYALEHGAEAVLLLNQDTVVEKGFLAPLLKNPADIVGPVIKFKRTGEWVYDYGGRINWWLGRNWHLERVHLGGVEVVASPPSEVFSIRGVPLARMHLDYVSGCAMLIKRPVLEKIVLLDENFFLYFEDVDFCLRAKKASFKIGVEPKSVVVHKLSEKERKPLWQHLQMVKSNFLFVNRWIPWWRRPLAYGYLGLLLGKVMMTHLGGVMASQAQPDTDRGVGGRL